jgi:lipoprotein-anchoring transpeptidase ErfK/SrfK
MSCEDASSAPPERAGAPGPRGRALGRALALAAVAGAGALLAAALWASEVGDPGPTLGGGAHAANPEALARLAPRGIYVVVDTARNELSLRRGSETVYTAVVSTGSGARLIDPRDPQRGWRFDTPRGVFTVRSKHVNPVWVRPDWAFLEEGLPIPARPEDRAQPGVLGRYALGIGDGYFIHGTLYTRLLGTNVTHGCIRLGDADLAYVFKTVPLGATVLIY